MVWMVKPFKKAGVKSYWPAARIVTTFPNKEAAWKIDGFDDVPVSLHNQVGLFVFKILTGKPLLVYEPTDLVHGRTMQTDICHVFVIIKQRNLCGRTNAIIKISSDIDMADNPVG